MTTLESRTAMVTEEFVVLTCDHPGCKARIENLHLTVAQRIADETGWKCEIIDHYPPGWDWKTRKIWCGEHAATHRTPAPEPAKG